MEEIKTYGIVHNYQGVRGTDRKLGTIPPQNSFKNKTTVSIENRKKNLPQIVKLSEWLGWNVGEHMHLAARIFGIMVISPLAIIIAPGPKTETSKNEKKYTAIRLPISGVIMLVSALAFTEPVKKFLEKLSRDGKLPEDMHANFSLKTHSEGDRGVFKTLFKKYKGQTLIKPHSYGKEEIYSIVGNKSQHLSPQIKNKLDKFLSFSHKLQLIKDKKELTVFDAETIAEKQGFAKLDAKKIEMLLESFGFNKDILAANTEKKETVTSYLKLKNHYADLATLFLKQKKELSILEKELSQQIKQFIKSPALNKEQLKKFKKLLDTKFPAKYKRFEHLAMFIGAIASTTVAAIIINLIYPIIIKKINPELVKSLNNASMRKE